MSRRHAVSLLVLLAIAVAVVAIAESTPAAGGFTELYRVDLVSESDGDSDGDLEAVMGIIERSSAAAGAKHYHPGGEFGFVLEGSLTVTTESGSRTLEQGSHFHQPAGEWHSVSTGSEGTRTIVFRVLEKGQPMIVPGD